ncbi:nitrile hydratase beta subunit [Brevirhabdus pacifica]|nr:nitrile hydratase beta subunit [Brevirhabdus pacifica]
MTEPEQKTDPIPESLAAGRRWHDMGGDISGDGGGPIPREGHDYALWEKRIDALMVLCGEKGLMTVDGLRRVLEDMGPESFETMGYYERWIASVNQNLLEGGVYTTEELGTRMEAVARRGASYGEAAGG